MKIQSSYSLEQIAEKVHGNIIGSRDHVISSLAPLDEPTAGGLSFTKDKASKKIASLLDGSPLSAIIVPQGFDRLIPFSQSLIEVPDPFEALISLIPLFFQPNVLPEGVHEKADIHSSVKLGEGVRIGAFCSVSAKVEIGDNVILHPHVTIYAGVKIGARTVIHSGAVIREDCTLGEDLVIQNGAVIGAEGFGYTLGNKGLTAVPQVGGVTLGDRVEIGANSCVDRATLGNTTIGFGTKIDNLVQIGHNNKIGKHGLLCAQVGIGGSCNIGDTVVFGGQVGVKDHTKIVSKVRIAAKGGVTSDIEKTGDYAGFPTVPIFTFRRQLAAMVQSGRNARVSPPGARKKDSEET